MDEIFKESLLSQTSNEDKQMNEGYALRYLRLLMGWSFEIDNDETSWLRVLSDFKYDTYRDFWAGTRFVEALLNWLQQFESSDRQIAYDFVRNRLIFISFSEIQHLISRTFPVYARDVIASRVAAKMHIPKYMVWATNESRQLYQDTLKRTLFVGLSDGARIDGFRRANAGVVVNDQVALGYEISPEKWHDLATNLRNQTGDSNAKFEILFLIDDFVGSGKTLLRLEKGKWKGKLVKFAQDYARHDSLIASDAVVAVHHYIGTEQAKVNIADQLAKISVVSRPANWFHGDVQATFDLFISTESTVKVGQDKQLDYLLNKYYDPGIESPSLGVGGDNSKYGFAGCGLPLVLEHNTPNNSLALLWAESPAANTAPSTHRMVPLFRRRQRHT